MPFVLATPAAGMQAPTAGGRPSTAALAQLVLQLLAQYTRLAAAGRLDAAGHAAWREAVALYQQLVSQTA